MENINKYRIQAENNILNGKLHFSKKYSLATLNKKLPALYYLLKGSGIVWIDKVKYDIKEKQSIFVGQTRNAHLKPPRMTAKCSM